MSKANLMNIQFNFPVTINKSLLPRHMENRAFGWSVCHVEKVQIIYLKPQKKTQNLPLITGENSSFGSIGETLDMLPKL